MNTNAIILTINVLLQGVSILCSYPEVTLPLGKVEGYYTTTKNGLKYAAFEGVPYAKPPIGKKRFQEAQPIEPWQGIIKADILYKCIQYSPFINPGTDRVKGDEDCLYLNIYTTNLNKSSILYDVVVFIHGGAFMYNYGGLYRPDIIIDRNVIFVTLNYRLGPIGFLSTEDEVVPGNNGLKDQVLALKWIKKYIQYFGGNPKSITLTGMSAGGASAHLHTLSPLSKGLFTRGISQSGVALNPWVLVENSRTKCQQIAMYVGCPTNTTQEMVDCLRSRTAYQIVNAVKLFQPWLYNPFSPFGVVVDKWSPNPMIPEHPYNLLRGQKVQDLPWIFSHTESEGLYPAASFVSDPRYLPEIDKRWNDLIPHILDFNNTIHPQQKITILQEIRDYYFQGQAVTKETFRTLVNLISDRMFVADSEMAARMHAAAIKSPVYYYYFAYRGAHSKSELWSGSKENFGASHGDDTFYVLEGDVKTRTTETDRQMSQLLTDIWISFISNGTPQVPNLTWSPLSTNKEDDLQYLVIESPTNLKLKSSKFLGNRQFWESIPLKENKNIVTNINQAL